MREFPDTLVLALTVCLRVLANSRTGAWSTAASLTWKMSALGKRSGAHFDPAAAFTRRMSEFIGTVVRTLTVGQCR